MDLWIQIVLAAAGILLPLLITGIISWYKKRTTKAELLIESNAPRLLSSPFGISEASPLHVDRNYNADTAIKIFRLTFRYKIIIRISK